MSNLPKVLEYLKELSVSELNTLSGVVKEELSYRLSEGCESGDLTDEAFTSFPHNGKIQPYIKDNILVALGYKVDRSRFSHDCSFLKVGDGWVWEYSERINDEIRSFSTDTRFSGMRSVSLIPAIDGLLVDQISMRMRNGVHEVKNVVSFEIINGSLVTVPSRKSTLSKHR